MPDCDHVSPRYRRAADLLGKRWTALILKALLPGARRFSYLTEAIPGLSDRLLSQRLRELEGVGILTRHVYPAVPVRIEYALTAKGYDLERVLTELQRWADRWEPELWEPCPAGAVAEERLFPEAV